MGHPGDINKMGSALTVVLSACPLGGLFGATLFTILCIFLVIFLFKMAPKCGAVWRSQHKEAVTSITEKTRVTFVHVCITGLLAVSPMSVNEHCMLKRYL